MICYICKLRRGKYNKKNYPVPVAKEIIQEDAITHKKNKIRMLIGVICKVCVKKAVKIQRRIDEQRKIGAPILTK